MVHIISGSNPRWADQNNTTVQVELETAEFGGLLYFATEGGLFGDNDVFAEAQSGTYGPIAPYAAPPPTTDTNGRPLNPRPGQVYFDDALDMPIWWSVAQNGWVDASGVKIPTGEPD